MSADLKVIADALDPSAESTLKNQTTEVVNLVARIRTAPDLHGVLFTKGMAQLDSSRRNLVESKVGSSAWLGGLRDAG